MIKRFYIHCPRCARRMRIWATVEDVRCYGCPGCGFTCASDRSARWVSTVLPLGQPGFRLRRGYERLAGMKLRDLEQRLCIDDDSTRWRGPVIRAPTRDALG